MRSISSSIAATWRQPFGQSSHDPYIGRRAAEFLGTIRSEASALVISGDIAANGSDEDLAAAFELVTGVPHRLPDEYYLTQRGHATFAGLGIPIIVLPGNHDRFRPHTFFSSGGTKFDEVFSSLWGDPNPHVVADVLQKEDAADALGVVSADCCLHLNRDAQGTPVSFLGQGKAYAYIIEMLEYFTAKIRRENDLVGIIWVLHFDPTSVCSYDLQLIANASFNAAAIKNNIQLVLCGHSHESSLETEGSLKIARAGTVMAYMCQDGNWIHSIDIKIENNTASFLKRDNYLWHTEADCFLLFSVDHA